MLLRFRFSNHLSINEEQELSLIASSLHDTKSGLLSSAATKEHILPSAVIYGANASGKSNVVDAFDYVRYMVRTSHTREPGSGMPRARHRLDPMAMETPSRFVVDFILDAVRYQYGFAVSAKRVEEEWLTAYPNDRPQKLFGRRRDNFTFSRLLKGRNRLIADLTRPDSLFVSAGAQNDHETLTRVAQYVRSWRFDHPFGRKNPSIRDREVVDPRVIQFLDRMGTGVVSYRQQRKKIGGKSAVFQKELQRFLGQHFGGEELPPLPESETILELGHRARDGHEVHFPLERESDGTQRLLFLLSAAFEALAEGSLLVVDELDASLHTQACEEILALFGDAKLNKKGAQMIATTHDTNLMNAPSLRRDQVWFVSKDEFGASHLYPLTDIRTRKEDNIEKGYLEGRYGAVPLRP